MAIIAKPAYMPFYTLAERQVGLWVVTLGVSTLITLTLVQLQVPPPFPARGSLGWCDGKPYNLE